MNFDELVTQDLARRGWEFSIEEGSGRYVIPHEGGSNTVCLDNLRKEFSQNGDASRIERFFDSIEASRRLTDIPLDVDKLFWSLEPNDYPEKPYVFEPLSNRIDQVLVQLDEATGLITFVTEEMLQKAGLVGDDASDHAYENLDTKLKESTLECQDVLGMRLGIVSTKLPFKTALILAPSLQTFVESTLGWPVLAVVPDRDFLYLWSPDHSDLTSRIGSVVLREYEQAPYPLTTEVFEIADDGIGAVGFFGPPN